MKTTLVVLAAGLSSRFGGKEGQKVVEALGQNGEAICDFSVYDAIAAGFDKIVYVIKSDKKEEFIEKVSSKIKSIEVVLCYQDMDDLPKGFSVPSGRQKPWGTCHALWAARHVVHEPFMVISADDFFGRGIFKTMHEFLTTAAGEASFAMPGHRLGETVSEHGSVSRAVCDINENGFVQDIREIRAITKQNDGIGYELNGQRMLLSPGTIVNMLSFAFAPSIFEQIEKGFAEFFENYAKHDLTSEYYLNSIVRKLILKGDASLKVLPVDSKDRWMGVTYKPDMEKAKEVINKLIDDGEYPSKLFP